MNPEELRPKTLDEMVGQTQAVRVLKGLIGKHARDGLVPHLLFSGPPGTGKTTAAHAFARGILGEEFDSNFYEMNASEERRIADVRETIASYVAHQPNGDAEFKILLLDEADYLTPEAQSALRRLMETGANTTRFILTANDPYQIIPALHSRCLSLPFRPLTDDEIREVVRRAVSLTGAQLPPATLEAIIERADGEPRRAVFLVAGGDEEIARWVRLDDRIGEFLAPPNGTTAVQRVESFAQWLRQEGIGRDGRDAALVLDTMRKVAWRKKAVSEAAWPQLMEVLGNYAFRLGDSAVPLLHVRSALYAWVRVTGVPT